MNSQFNAIDYAHELVTAGVPQAQAEVHAKALSLGLSTCAATKGDLAQKLTTCMDLFEAKIDARLNAFEAKIEARLNAFEAKIEARLNAFEAKINARFDAFEADRKYDRRVINFVLALQLALIAKAFFF
jgi:CHASE1-domain containing sensor protein